MILIETMRSFMHSEENVSSAFTCNLTIQNNNGLNVLC